VPCAMLTIVDRLHVATLNILNLADRWPERQGLIYADMAALQPDLLALQEVVYVMHQDRLIGAAGEGSYAASRGWAGRPEYGNSLLVRQPLRAEAEGRIDLGLQRSAHRVRIALPGGATVVAAVSHFHHTPEASAERDEQARTLLAWLDEGPPADAMILAGDFNASPAEPTYARIEAAGFRSAHREAHGSEPERTWPSGLIAPAMDTEGKPNCLDYIWVRGAIRVVDCRLAFDRPDATDPTLYPSDHFGLAAHLEIG
jgi:endonuclease/exonuclease/phosphatase family metal-dependent hydrolase